MRTHYKCTPESLSVGTFTLRSYHWEERTEKQSRGGGGGGEGDRQGQVHSHLCGCGLNAPMGDQGPVAPSAGIESTLLCLLVDLHQECLMTQFFILIG